MSDEKLKEAIRRERLGDELHALQWANAAQQPGESYEQCLERRARMSLRRDEILRELAWYSITKVLPDEPKTLEK